MYFVGDDGSRHMLVYQPRLDMSELNKDKDTDYFFSWESKGYTLLNLSHYILPSYKA